MGLSTANVGLMTIHSFYNYRSYRQENMEDIRDCILTTKPVLNDSISTHKDTRCSAVFLGKILYVVAAAVMWHVTTVMSFII